MGAVVGPQHIARVAIAMQAQRGHVTGASVRMADGIERLGGDGLPRGTKIGRNEIMRKEPIARRVAE